MAMVINPQKVIKRIEVLQAERDRINGELHALQSQYKWVKNEISVLQRTLWEIEREAGTQPPVELRNWEK